MKRHGHSETQVATIGSKLKSGEWLRRREGSLKKLATGLRHELSRFPPRVARGFVAYIVTVVAASEAFESCFSEERRIEDLEKMLAMAERFLETCGRKAVFFHPNQLDFGLTSHAAAEKRDAQISDTENLNDARVAALEAVGLYRLGLEAALETASRRRQGEKRTANENDFFGKIARQYREAFDENPVSTPGGTFANIVVLIREYQAGKAKKDVGRIVRAALKSI